jgi:hypothetical protein
VLGTNNTGAEGDVFHWKNATVGGNMLVLNNLSADKALTVACINVMSELANVANKTAAKEPAFTAVAPLQRGLNLQTGDLELRVESPFCAAGKVSGTGAVLTSSGQVGFRCPGPGLDSTPSRLQHLTRTHTMSCHSRPTATCA